MAKDKAKIDRSAKNRYSLKNKKLFLEAWIEAYEGHIQNEDEWDCHGLCEAIEFAFLDFNLESERTANQKIASIMAKAKKIRAELLELGTGCPPVPNMGESGDLTISVATAIKDPDLKAKLDKYK